VQSRGPRQTGPQALGGDRGSRDPAGHGGCRGKSARRAAARTDADTLDRLGPLPAKPTVHVDRGYDSATTRQELAACGMAGQIATRGRPAPVQASRRWPVERTHGWGNQFKKLVWNTERCEQVMDAFLAFARAIITLRRLIRCAWTLYRWDARPPRRP
jgi:IS5 family transposase